jgi:hypothetical protein
VKEHGWSKYGTSQMHKLDSFMREIFRFHSSGCVFFVSPHQHRNNQCPPIVSLVRMSMVPYTFSNGVTVPAGTMLAAPQVSVHADNDIYDKADEFQPFRFVKATGDGSEGPRLQMATTSMDYRALAPHAGYDYDLLTLPSPVTFGYGRHGKRHH